MRRLHLALFAVLTALGTAPLYAATMASVSGVVRDSSGVPQMGAQVQLLRSDLTVIATTTTDDRGNYSFSSILPGQYALKAMGAMFLPSLRENLRVRAATVINLTLNTLYEVMQWLPSQPRTASTPKDDWAWTLRSAANRPLLRWLEDGPLVVVSDGSGRQPRLKARLVATGAQGSFGEDGQRISLDIEDTPSSSRELLAHVDFDPSSNAGMESMLGFRQDLGVTGSVESVAAVSIHPEIESGDASGLEEAAVRSSENLTLGDELDAEVGAEQVMARFDQSGPNAVFAALPFATLGWHDGNSTVHYSMATALPASGPAADSTATAYLPALSVANGRLEVERGVHQEIGWERRTDASGVSIAVFADSLSNPVLEASYNGAAPAAGQALADPDSNLLRTAANGFSTAGVVASFERRLPGGNFVRLSYANGDALVLADQQHTAVAQPLNVLVASARPHRTQMYSISLSGTLDGTGTRWRASYRWQPEETLTRVAPYATDATDPYLNLHISQPFCRNSSEHRRCLDAIVNVRNLLAQGYRPYILNDGSLLIFAQDQRSMSAGVAFTF